MDLVHHLHGYLETYGDFAIFVIVGLERAPNAGFSGGSMERPALQKLLDDVRARKIDVIVVWGWISARIRRRDRLQLSRNDPFVMARAIPALSRARRSRGKSRVDSIRDAHWLLRGSGRQSPRDDATRPARGKTKVEWSWQQMANSAEATIPAQDVAFTQQAA